MARLPDRPPTTDHRPLFLGVDLGTSGCRGVAVDGDGSPRARAAVALPEPRRGDDGAVDQDPALWWTAVAAVLKALATQVDPRAVAAVAVDGTSATTLVTDPAGAPLAPALMYNDSRARGEAERVARVAPRESGAHGPSASLAKALWLLARNPAAARIAHQADWVAGRLGGRSGVTDENNALKLGYDPRARRWPPWLADLGLAPALLPRVVPPGTPLGPLDPAVARELGLTPETRVVAGTTDSIAAVIATGATTPGDAVTSLGSTLVLKVFSPRPVSAPDSGVYSHRLGDLWLAGGASNSGGAALLAHFTREEMARLTPRLDPDHPTGLAYYPLPAPGERFPRTDPAMESRVHPRTPDRVRFFQGLLEGIAAIEAAGYRRLADLGAPYPRRVLTMGGGSHNPAWTRIRARLLGVPVTVPMHTEAAYGAALLARRGAGTQYGRSGQAAGP